MKKILIFLSMVIPFFLISSTKIFAHSPYYQANVFDLSTQVVNFGDSDYYVLRSPYRDTVEFTNKIYTINGDNLLYSRQEISGFNTPVLSNGQYVYTSISNMLSNKLIQHIDENEITFNDLVTVTFNGVDVYVSYTLDIDYTSSTPFNVIWSYSGTLWNNGWNVPVNNLAYGLKVQFFAYVDDSDNAFNYVSVYFYDVNGNQITGGGSFTYSLDDDFNLGLAIKPDTTSVDTAYINGYDNGYNNGQSNGFIDGYGKGKDDGYNSGYGTGYDKGYNQGSTDNMPNFFVLMTDSVFTAVTRIGNVEILPNLKISYIAGIILALGLVKFITGRKGDD